MEQTFEQMKDAAKEVHRRFYKYCDSSFNDIVNTDNVRDLRRVVIRYRDYVSDPSPLYPRELCGCIGGAGAADPVLHRWPCTAVFGKLISPIMEWNNHPFEKDTPVRTFGSRSGLAAPGTPRIAIGASSTTNASCAMRSWRRTSATGGYRCGSPSGSDVYMTRSICPPVSKARAGNDAFCLQICGERGNTESGCECTDFLIS